MKKKNRKIRRRENVVMFPGTFEKLIQSGIQCVERKDYEQAVIAFDQAIQYEPDSPHFLGPYAIALYETRNFERAKEVTSHLLHTGHANYIETMELYLTISIQLQHYEEVEMTIQTLYDEDIIPPELVMKFDYLRELTNRLSRRYPMREEIPFTFEQFCEMDVQSQQRQLAALEGTALQHVIPLLTQIVEDQSFRPIIVSFALTLLKEAEWEQQLVVKKFGRKAEVIPANLALPGEHVQIQEVQMKLENLLGQDPSKLALATSMVEKFAILAYPLTWGEYAVDDIANTYAEYISSMFSGEQISQTELSGFIIHVDNEMDL